jgi:hypothetical protein
LRRTLTLAEGVRAQSLRRLVRHKVTCAFCGRRYLPRRLRFVGFDDDVWLFLGACGHCQSLALIGVVLQNGRSSLRELTSSELVHFGGRPAVTTDDLLDVHDRLASFDGDFRGLFGSLPPTAGE